MRSELSAYAHALACGVRTALSSHTHTMSVGVLPSPFAHVASSPAPALSPSSSASLSPRSSTSSLSDRSPRNDISSTRDQAPAREDIVMKGEDVASDDIVAADDLVLKVQCGTNEAAVSLAKLRQGSRTASVLFNGAWISPNQFQNVSGRQKIKDWKRSIRHHGRTLRQLMGQGLLRVDPPSCACGTCRASRGDTTTCVAVDSVSTAPIASR